ESNTMKVFLTVATIIAICASIIMGILLLTDPGPRALGTDQIEKYDLPGETEVVNYYLLADEIKFDYTASSRRVEITKDNRTLSFQLYDKLVIDLGVEKWTQLERNDDIATLLPPCKYIQ